MTAGLDLSKGKLAEWVFRLLVLVGLLWLSANYVSLKDYKADEARKLVTQEGWTRTLNEIHVTLGRMDERATVDDSKVRIQKLEDKVSALEKKVP
jgi:hypothetical protein